MMSSPSQVLVLLGELADQQDLSETENALRFSARFPNEKAQGTWLRLKHNLPPALSQLAITLEGTDVPLEADAPFSAERRYRFSLIKERVNGELRLFLNSSLNGHLMATAGIARIRVAQLERTTAFETRGLSFEPWSDLQPLAPYAPEGIAIDPSKRVLDLADPRIVPSDLRPWLQKSAPALETVVYSTWKAEAAGRLWASLVDQVAGRSPTLRYRLSGPPVVDLDLTREQISAAFWPLHTAAEWVFVETTDQDARHLLFAIELAHTLRASGQELPDAIPLALENAKAAYRAHIQAANRDTLKALGDLRRAVIEETQKIVQRTQELTSALWRDLLVAAAPFVIKILPDSTKIVNAGVARIFLVVAASYLVASFVALTAINRDYFSEQTRARVAWKDSVARYLPSAELQRITDQPVLAAKTMYDRVHFGVGIFYGLLVIALIAAAFAA